jgi:hypothetical protein
MNLQPGSAQSEAMAAFNDSAGLQAAIVNLPSQPAA